MDSKVIDGHIIPREVLFTAPTKRDHRFETLAEVDNMRVFISFSSEHGERSDSGRFKLINLYTHPNYFIELSKLFFVFFSLREESYHNGRQHP